MFEYLIDVDVKEEIAPGIFMNDKKFKRFIADNRDDAIATADREIKEIVKSMPNNISYKISKIIETRIDSEKEIK